MNYVLIDWRGEERMVPGCGMARRGHTLSVPENMAVALIKEGLATRHKVPSGKTKPAKAEDNQEAN